MFSRLIACIAVLSALWIMPTGALAQTSAAQVYGSCGTAGYTAGSIKVITQDTTGKLCTSAAGGGSSNATIVGPLGAQTAAASVATTINGTLPAFAAPPTVAASNLPTTVDTNAGAAGASTLRVVPATGSTTANTSTGYTTTVVGTTVTTHLTFQTLLAANASRAGCLVQNTSSDLEYVFFGANGSATTAKSIQLGAGGSLSCAVSGNGVATDNLAITSATKDGATYVVNSQ